MSREASKGQPVIDILEINRLRRQLLFQSYTWDHRLVYAANLDINSNGLKSEISEQGEKIPTSGEKVVQMNVLAVPETGSSFYDSLLADAKLDKSSDREEGGDSSTTLSDGFLQETIMGQDSNLLENDQGNISASISFCEQSGSLESEVNVRRTLSEGQVPVVANLSDTLEAAWTGENYQVNNTYGLSDSPLVDSSTVAVMTEGLDLEDHMEVQTGAKVTQSLSPALSSKGPDNMEEPVGWFRMPFLNFYRSLNKNFLLSSQKLDTMSGYNPIYFSSFRDSELNGGARLFLPVGVNDTVVPVYDDEPASIIAYALVSTEYHVGLMVDDGEKTKEGGDVMSSFSLSDSVNLQSHLSADELTLDLYRSLGSTDESILSLSGSRSSLILDPLSYTKAFHPKVSFKDDGPLGQVKYSVTCYYARRFEALRKICCPSELDYVRSLSRCKKWGAKGGKSNVFFAKTLDDRFIIKQVTKTELESFIKFAPEYFKYLSESISTGSPTCLAKILGIYQVPIL